MLTGSELSPEVDLGLHSDSTGLSDTSSDSGVVEDPYRRTLLSPGLDDGPSSMTYPSSNITTNFSNRNNTLPSKIEIRGLNLVDYISSSCSSVDESSDPMFTVDPLKIDGSMDGVDISPIITRQIPYNATVTQQKR